MTMRENTATTAAAAMESKPSARITLYRGFPPSNQYTRSPFVTKVEFRLRLAGIAYQNLEGNPTEGLSGKIPHVDTSALSGGQTREKELVGDSAVIIQTLIDQSLMVDHNERLSAGEKLTDEGIKASFEEKLYFLQMGERLSGDNYYVQRDQILGSKSWLLKVVIGCFIHRKVMQTSHLQGSSRFSEEEQRTNRHEIWRTIEEALMARRRTVVAGNKAPFWCLGGQQATEADATLFGFINSALIARSSPDTVSFVRRLPAVMHYAARIHDTYFPDYKRWES